MDFETITRAGLAGGISLAALMAPGAATAQDDIAQEVAVVPERSGVLTPKGRLMFEPSLEYQNSSTNNFTFQGVEIIDTVLIGVITAGQQEDDTVTASAGFRYGLTDRLELEVKIPYVYRDFQSVDQRLVSADAQIDDTSVSGGSLGDIEVAAHYQMNDGGGDWPIFVGNLRVKSDSGRGPFEVDRNGLGIETEVATGSGFWGVEPSLTMLVPSDPAVFFTNVGYLWNIEEDVDAQVGEAHLSTVDPGDAIRVSLGMGIGLNEKTSFSLSYKHDYIMETEIDGFDTGAGDDLQVGVLGLGMSYQVNDRVGLNFNIDAGLTDDAPDVRVILRVPVMVLE